MRVYVDMKDTQITHSKQSAHFIIVNTYIFLPLFSK